MSSKKKFDESKETFAKLRKYHPKAMKGFLEFVQGVDSKGALSKKFKQIISVALSVAKQCEWCIAYHTKKALELGATKDELMEACFVAAFFGGGPAMMYTKLVMDAIDEFSNEKAD